MTKLQPVRGTHDILPEESRRRHYLLQLARAVFECYGFGEITPPMFEFSEVFQRTLGDTSDVVTKETYSFPDRGGESLTLRPEFTAGIARAFISHGMKDKLPLKFCYYGPAFRYERPQKGRLRQFHQLGAELLGVATPQADIEIIALAVQLLTALGLKDTAKLELNTLGDAESRQKYRAALVEFYQAEREQLSAESQARLARNPLRILDSKDEGDRRINAAAPAMTAYFTPQAEDFFARVKEGLESLSISFYLNPRLVRGLDYYSHTVFEFTSDALGAQNTLLAGGRYDGLVAMMGGADTPGIGLAAGVERLLDMMDFTSCAENIAPPRPVVVIPQSDAQEKNALILTQELRGAGIYAELGYSGNMGKRMKRADTMNARAAVILGEEEEKAGNVSLKWFDSGEQVTIPRSDLLGVLKS